MANNVYLFLKAMWRRWVLVPGWNAAHTVTGSEMSTHEKHGLLSASVQASLLPPAGREDRDNDSKFPLSVSLLREPFGFHHMTSPNGRPPNLISSRTDNCIQEVIETYTAITTMKFSRITRKSTSLRIPETVSERKESMQKTHSIQVRKSKN